MKEKFSVGSRIKELRKLKGRSGAQVASYLGVTKQAVSKWENDISMPDVMLLPKLAEYFDVSIESLYGGKVDLEGDVILNKGDVIIEAKNIFKKYNPKIEEYALKDCSIKVYSNLTTAIMGGSGAGKSTLLNCISGLESITSGSINILGTDISNMKETKLTKFRRENINFIFQQYNLVDTLNVRDNIFLPYKLSGERIDKKRYKELILKLGLEGKEKSLPQKLSGGQQQRVAIARALLGKNKIIFADEPTGALDLKTGQQVLELLLIASKEFNLPVVIITHDASVASKCDVVNFLVDGKVHIELERPSGE